MATPVTTAFPLIVVVVLGRMLVLTELDDVVGRLVVLLGAVEVELVLDVELCMMLVDVELLVEVITMVEEELVETEEVLVEVEVLAIVVDDEDTEDGAVLLLEAIELVVLELAVFEVYSSPEFEALA